jgi:ribosomal-protein-alanine N-acetyltransferase
MNKVLKIRAWAIKDLGNLVRHANNWNVAKNMTDKFPFPYSESNARSFIAFATQGDPLHIFAIEVDEQAVGGIGIHPQDDIHRRNAELGYWLAEPYWGQGIISAAIRQAVDFAFRTYDIDRVFARPFSINVGSQRVLEKNGFTLEGKFEKVLVKDGELLDELIYAIRREAWQS